MKTIKPAESLSDYWSHHIQSWQQTGANQSSYCRTHNLNYHRFTYWRRKLIAPESTTRKAVLRSGFVPVKTVSQVSTSLTA
jgi:hypothetical protein